LYFRNSSVIILISLRSNSMSIKSSSSSISSTCPVFLRPRVWRDSWLVFTNRVMYWVGRDSRDAFWFFDNLGNW
jgi:hypothetical protein